ncbi:MAG: KH domain-containing protein, partial [Candidatus Heimdallarchaeaceae archaeon]
MSSEFLVRIPVERIAVLIGPKGSTKKRIEELTHSKLMID